jgi:hypothetical protein
MIESSKSQITRDHGGSTPFGRLDVMENLSAIYRGADQSILKTKCESICSAIKGNRSQ